MANDGATLEARGVNSSGTGRAANFTGDTTELGMVKQYQKAGTTDTSSTNTIGPYDSGTILGTVPPGKSGLKLVSGVIQNATNMICNDSPLGNTLPSTASEVTSTVGTGVPAVNTAQDPANGLSLSPEHE